MKGANNESLCLMKDPSDAVLMSPVLNLNYNFASTDIPYWITACTQSKSFDWSDQIPVDLLQNRSPISQVNNFNTPSLIIVGDADKRVPPQ